MTTILLALTLLSDPSNTVTGDSLKHYQPEVQVYERSGSHILYEAGLPLHIIELFDKYLSEHFNDRMIFEIYRVPLTIELYLAATEGSDEERSRYYLFRKESAELIELGRSRGLEDDIRITRTTFFIGKDRVLVMAETGVPPDFGGLEVFEFKNNRLRYLGPLTVAKKIKPAGLHGDYISPLEDATVEYKANTYYLTMKGHLYSDWGYGSPEKKVATPDSTVTYYFDGKKFRMLPKKRSNRN